MRIAEAIYALAEEVRLLREAIKEEGALLRIVLENVPKDEPDERSEKINKMFTEGLDNLLSYNGGRNE